MSPLGPLRVHYPSFLPSDHLVTNEGVLPSEHFLRLMSLSLSKDTLRGTALHFQKSRKMTLKMNSSLQTVTPGQGNENNNSSPKGLLHSIRNFIQTENEATPGGNGGGDDEEVLSIGKDDHDGERRSESKVGDENEDTDCDIDVDDDMSTVTTVTSQSQSPSPSSSRRSPTPMSVDNNLEPGFRLRNYSSEDSTKSPYNPLSSLSEAFINSNFQHQQQQQRHHQASLFFSIANILRPDFGLGRLGPLTVPQPPPFPGIGFLNQQFHRSSSKRSNNYESTEISQNPKRQRMKSDPVIPIDLSRPSAHDLSSSSIPNSNSSNKSTNHQSSRHKNSESKKQEDKNGKSNNTVLTSKEGSKSSSKGGEEKKEDGETIWPAWVYCTRYSDRPSSGPRTRRGRKQKEKEIDEKRPRTAFTAEQLSRLKKEFDENRYLTEKRRQDLANDLRLHENQIKIWFQNKRAKLKKSTGQRGGLALQLMKQGLYNHSTIPPRGCGDEDDEMSDE